MKKPSLSLLCLLIGASGYPAAAQEATEGGKEEITAAVQKLGESASYSWKTTMSMGADREFTSEGALREDGFAVIQMPGRDDTPMIAVVHGGSGAVEIDGTWRTAEELTADESPRRARFLARMIEDYDLPHEQAAELLGQVGALEKGDSNTYTGKISEEGLEELLSFGRRRGSDNPDRPAPTDRSGTASFTVADGVLTGYGYTVGASILRDGETRQFQRVTKVTLSDIGSANPEVPAGALTKLAPEGTPKPTETPEEKADDAPPADTEDDDGA